MNAHGRSLLKAPAVHPGARVAIVAPASPITEDELARGADGLRRVGFEPVWHEAVLARRRYVAGDAEHRAASVLEAWRDPEIAAIVAARGGFGSVHVLPYLHPDELRRSPKVFIGYSDITSMLTWLSVGCGIACLHGPMVDRRLSNLDAAVHVPSLLAAVAPSPMGELAPAGMTSMRSGEATGRLLGGTLTQLAASQGTPYAFLPDEDYLLLIEDVNERPYRLDRLWTQLRLAGALRRARGVIIGEMVGCEEPGGTPTAIDVLRDVLADFSGPIISGFPSGHTTGQCWTLPLGVRARLIADDAPRLVIEESAVS